MCTWSKKRELTDICELIKSGISVENRENVTRVSHINHDWIVSNNICHVRKSLIPVENSCNVTKEKL